MFLDYSKLFFKPSETAVRNIELIINKPLVKTSFNIPMVAYVLATVYHETGIVRNKKLYRDMAPVEEMGKGKGRPYGKPAANGKIYYGRGHVQLTWEDNYRKAGLYLGVDLINNPELALDETISSDILVVGSFNGWFTGKKLSHYFSNGKVDYLNARRIINGTDKADLIKGYAELFAQVLTL